MLVITAVTSMYAGSKFVGPELDHFSIIHIIIAGSIASAGSSALNHYLDRDIDQAGIIQKIDCVVNAFKSRGWHWGGDWKYEKDYQHFYKY